MNDGPSSEKPKSITSRITRKIGLERWQSMVIRPAEDEDGDREPAVRQRGDASDTALEPGHEEARRPSLPGRLLLVTVLLLLGWAAWTYWAWPPVATLETQNPTSTAFMDAYSDRSGEIPDWRWVDYSQIALPLKRAVLVAEDINFFHHNGFETAELKKAVNEAINEGKKLRGASTLTQQLAKNLWLSPSRNPMRKVKEAVLTRQLESRLGKRRILELYLNVVEFGPGIYGAEAAARHYFGKSASALTAHEAARMAASLPHSQWSPASETPSFTRYVARIEGRMARAAEWIDKSL